jgi:hypothetical protein
MRIRCALLTVLEVVLRAPAQDSLDPVFVTVPFSQWLAGPDLAQIPFGSSTSGPVLVFERLQITLNVTVDGALLAKRPAGHLLMLAQFTDSGGHVYQTHGDANLTEPNPETKYINVVITQGALVLPGDYQLAVALFYTGSGEHSLRREKVHVPTIDKAVRLNTKHDPLPEAWQGLPSVEFLDSDAPPAGAFKPWPTGRLHLPLETRNSVQIELLLILPPDRDPGSLIRSFQALSYVTPGNGTLSAAVLDLTRQRVSFEQDLSGAQPLDWLRLNAALREANPNMIDVGSLQNRRASADFFLEQIGQRIRSTGSSRKVVIIVSEAVQFDKDVPVHQIQPDGSAAELYYFRFWRSEGSTQINFIGGISSGGHGPGRTTSSQRNYVVGKDVLEGTLKPLHPRLFDLGIPRQGQFGFRKDLATMLKEIASR